MHKKIKVPAHFEMRAFMCNWISCADNREKFLEKQEKEHRRQLEAQNRRSLIRKELYPELQASKFNAVVGRSDDAQALYDRALWKSLIKSVNGDILARFRVSEPKQKKRITSLYI